MKNMILRNLHLTSNCTAILGHGNQGTVLKKDGYALKIFNSRQKRNNQDSIEVANRLSNLQLKHFVTPYDVKVKDGRIHSYKMDLIHRNKNKKFTDMDIQDVIKNIKEIKEDTKVISDNGILLRDFQEHNICIGHRENSDVDDSIILYDFSDYILSDSVNLKDINNSEIDALFGSILISHEMSDTNPLIIYDEIYSKYLKSECSAIEEYFSKNIKDQTISQYIKRKIK